MWRLWSFTCGAVGKNPSASAGDVRELGSIPGSGRPPGVGNGNPLQYSCLEKSHGERSLAGYNPWGHKVTDTTKWLSTHIQVWRLGWFFFFFLHIDIQLFQHYLLTRCFLLSIAFEPLQTSVDHICVDLFLVSLCCLTALLCASSLVLHYLDFYSCIVSLRII